jgi:transcription antitermination factor NusG
MSTAQLNWISETAQIPVPAAEDYSWYAIQTRVRFEKKVAAQLQRKGIEIFLPLTKQVHRWSDRRQEIDVALFPGYGFVHVYLDPATRLHILQTAGLIGFVRFNGEAVPVPRKQIEDIQQVFAKDVPCAMYPFLKAGQKVRIRGGCLDGLEGVLASYNSARTLLISIEAIERTIAIQVEGYDIEML